MTWNEADHPRDAEGQFARRMSDRIGDEMLSGPRWPDELADRLRRQHPGLKLDLHRTSSGHVVLSRIVVPERSRGTGTEVMNQIVKHAAEQGDILALTPSADFGGSKPRLIKFYKRFGFVENKGRNKDYGTSETMYRPVG